MLDRDDAVLLGRDRAIPGLGALLDPEAFLAHLQSAFPDLTFDAAEASYLRYKPRTDCLAGYRIRTGGGETFVYAKAYVELTDPRIVKAAARPARGTLLPAGRFVLPTAAIVVSEFPNDTKIKRLHEYIDRAEGEVRPLAYKPERRFVGRIARAAGFEVVKLYTPHGHAAAVAATDAIASLDLPVQRRTSVLGKLRGQTFEWIDGENLRDRMVSGTVSAEDLARAAATVRQLHSASGAPPGRRSRSTEQRRVRALAAQLREMAPSLERLIAACVARIDEAIARTVDGDALLHGDCYAKQVVIGATGSALIDFDEAATGPRGVDLGNFIAHLEYDALRFGLHRRRIDSWTSSFLNAYGTSARDDADLPAWIASALFQLGHNPFRTRLPSWADVTAQLLERILEILPAEGTAAAGRLDVDPACDPARNPALVGPALAAALGADAIEIERCRIVRERKGKRRLLEYDLNARSSRGTERIELVGKVRVKGVDRKTFDLNRRLRQAGFDERGGVAVPEPVALVPPAALWLQRRIHGETATERIIRGGGSGIGAAVADAILRIHQSKLSVEGRHGIAEELQVLAERLGHVARMRPSWSSRIVGILEHAQRVAAGLHSRPEVLIHRDFYPDHVLFGSNGVVYLLDFDLHAMGDPALDVGNFLGHLTELSLRCGWGEEGLGGLEQEVEDAYTAAAGEEHRLAIAIYRDLTLARHIYISTLFDDRRSTTPALLALVEERFSTIHAA